MLSAAESRRASDVTQEKARAGVKPGAQRNSECFVIERLYTGWFCTFKQLSWGAGASLRPLGWLWGGHSHAGGSSRAGGGTGTSRPKGTSEPGVSRQRRTGSPVGPAQPHFLGPRRSARLREDAGGSRSHGLRGGGRARSPGPQALRQQ